LRAAALIAGALPQALRAAQQVRSNVAVLLSATPPNHRAILD
jgi:hypothetical protein